MLSSPLRKRTLAAGVRTGRHQPVGTNVVCRGRSAFTVVQASLALTAAFDATTAGDPIAFVFAPESRSDSLSSTLILSCATELQSLHPVLRDSSRLPVAIYSV